jgi:hypothetical protein
MADCTHWWLIATADGPTSKGQCQRCGEVKEFHNHIYHEYWDEKGKRSRMKGTTAAHKAMGHEV